MESELSYVRGGLPGTGRTGNAMVVGLCALSVCISNFQLHSQQPELS